MKKMYVFKVSNANVGKHFLSEVKKIRYTYWGASHPVTNTIKYRLGYKVLCVDVEVGSLTSNDLSAHKIWFGADSPDCLLVGVMDSLGQEIDKLSAQLTNFMSRDGEFVDPLLEIPMAKRSSPRTITNKLPSPQVAKNPAGFQPRLMDLD